MAAHGGAPGSFISRLYQAFFINFQMLSWKGQRQISMPEGMTTLWFCLGKFRLASFEFRVGRILSEKISYAPLHQLAVGVDRGEGGIKFFYVRVSLRLKRNCHYKRRKELSNWQ
jgi:hypothetical protein